MAILSTLSTVWKNRRHFKMQIFGVTVFLVILIFAINLVTIKTGYDKKLKSYMSTNVQYTSNIQMSLSGVKGTVDRIYIDNSRTQCFMLLGFKNSNSMTMTANNYQMFLTNVDNNGTSLGVPEENLTGEIYMFGSTGIVGLYIKSDIPFENGLKEVVLRSYSKFTANTQPYYRKTSTDADYDQCHIYFNPGGSGARTIDFLENHVEGTAFDLTEIYRQVNSVNEEIKIREQILQAYEDMRASISKIVEYRNRLINNHNIEVPDFPTYMKGDGFDTIAIYNAAGEQVGSYEKFTPGTIVPGGTEYDWYMGSIFKGYYKSVPNTKGMTIPEYMTYLNNDKNTREKPKVDIKEWRYADGTEVLLEGNLSPYGQQVANDVNLYVEELRNYLTIKTNYQTKYLPNLLTLEHNSANTVVSYTVRNDENTLRVY